MAGENNSVQAGSEVATQEDQTLEAQDSLTESAPEETQEQQPQYVTKDDLLQFGETLANRIKKSNKDRSKHIENEVATLKKKLEGAGVQIQPQQEQALRDQIADQLDGGEELEAEPQEEQVDGVVQVEQAVNGIVETFGVKVNPQSPNFQDLKKTILETWNDPNGYKKVLQASIRYGEAEKQRLASNQENAGARVVGSGGASTGQPQNIPANSLWKDAYKK